MGIDTVLAGNNDVSLVGASSGLVISNALTVAGIRVNGVEELNSTGVLNGSEGDDTFTFGTTDTANGIDIVGITTFDAGGGSDTVNITSVNETATLTAQIEDDTQIGVDIALLNEDIIKHGYFGKLY